ncbi:hypothetical protein ACGF5F_32465 [Streptomyces sp. NPDC047821]|uniref:hypothetical protein n=1 Tax=Streptomyces sp. NPDC047821 TaxID=3365488 RepID=UPI0037219AA8
MGYQLRRDLREALGPDITGLQRAVALEIADDANDDTRESIAKMEDLARWTGAKDAVVVRNALKRLAAAGWEFRVPIGKGRDGRVLYAVPGIRTTFKVPPFEVQGVATATSKGEPPLPHGGAAATPSTPQGVATAHSEGATAHSEGATATPYSSPPHSPQEEEASSGPGGAAASPSSSARQITADEKREFGNFWSIYPKSKDYDRTLEEWTTAVLGGAEPQQITAAAVAYAREMAGEPFQYLKHSANWIRDRRYEDKYAPEPNGRPNLKAVKGTGHKPFQQPTDTSAYANGF